MKKTSHAMLDVKRFAIAGGATFALALFFLGAFASLYGIGNGLVNVMGTVFQGYGPTPVGVGIGVIWGFIDGALAAALFAWIYNSTV